VEVDGLEEVIDISVDPLRALLGFSTTRSVERNGQVAS